MQYVFFEKVYVVYNGIWGKVRWGSFREFLCKSNLEFKLLLTKLQKKMDLDVILAPPIILLREQLPPLFPRLWAEQSAVHSKNVT